MDLEMVEFDVNVEESQPAAAPRTEQVALECYLGALAAIGKAAAGICPHLGVSYENSLVRLRQRVAFSPQPATLTQSLASLQADLDLFASSTSSYFSRKTGNVASLLSVMAQAVEYFETRDYILRERLGLIASQMRTGLDNPTEADALRQVYEAQLRHLTAFIEKLSDDGPAVFEDLQQQIGVIETSLNEAEAQKGIDPLTSFVDREEMERLVRARVLAENKFSLLLFQVNSLDQTAVLHGDAVRDQIIQQFASRLAAQVRPRDVIARWTADRFAVIFECSAIDAGARAHQVAQWVSGPYPVVIDTIESKADVSAAVIVIESDPNESADDLLLRANAR